MARKKKRKVGSTGRFGSRYGTRVRQRVKTVEEREKGKHDCPNCSAKKVERVGSGIWKCERCGAKFAAKAYTPSTAPLKRDVSESGMEEE